jgi:predicted CoA-substrate-specific enzyme activase
MKNLKVYVGIDVGSVSTNVVAIDEKNSVLVSSYIRTHGNPLKSVQEGLKILEEKLPEDADVAGLGVTGSARYLIAAMVGADIIKNEITAHAIAATHFYPEASTIMEIGGQDSKIIILDSGIVTDFAMNNVCAAGTGSFLDQQSTRLGIPIEDFGARALESTNDVRIAGRCTVFAESDMVHKQQLGYTKNDIINGLCEALVRNYFSTVAKGKDIKEPILFQGGVAANIGIIRAFKKYLGKDIIIPEYYNVMGAIGSAILSKESMENKNRPDLTSQSKFKGFNIKDMTFKTTSFTCKDCANHCEVVEFWQDGKKIALFGDKCGKHTNQIQQPTNTDILSQFR